MLAKSPSQVPLASADPEKARFKWILGFLLLLLPTLIIYCLCVGRFPISWREALNILWGVATGATPTWEPMAQSVVIGLRLPRILASVVVGGSLAVSGAAYQGVFKNPLVSPDFLGVSAGAGIGAALAILRGLGTSYIQLFAFCGGIIAVSLTLSIPRLLRSDSNIILVLSGIIVGGLMSSIMGYIRYIADPQSQLQAITFWMMGSFTYVRMQDLLTILPAVIIPAILLLRVSWWIDILSLGEAEAKTLGANVRYIRYLIVICATLLTASSVCISGTIGWIGLVIPHFGRIFAGPSNPRLLPVAFLMGSIFLLLVDTLTRTIGPVEMPSSSLTGLVGAPFYALVLYRQRMRLQ